MGLLDSNRVLTKELTGLEGTDFKLVVSNESFDLWEWQKKDTQSKLRVTFRDLFAWSDNYVLYLVKGKITDTPVAIEVNTTNFPGLRTTNGSLPKIERVIACPCDFFNKTYEGIATYGNRASNSGGNCRICVIFNNGQIYHNYPSCYDDCDFYSPTYAVQGGATVEEMFTKFAESVVWDIAGRKHPVKTNTGDDAALIATGAYYYNPALDDKCYEFHPALNAANGYGNTVGFGATNNVNPASAGTDIGLRARFFRTDMDNVNANSFSYMGGYAVDNQYTMVGTYRSNITANPCRICVFGTQDGGRNWYTMYEFGGKGRIKYGESLYKSASGTVGIPLKQTGSAGSDIYTIKRRTQIIPYTEAKEPSVLFEYGTPIDVASITGDSDGIIFTTGSAHGLIKGDVLVVDFQSGVTADSRAFDWMVNSAADGTTGGNGVMFVVSDVTSTTFKATLFIWNPDNNLPVRHIHALNKCKDGVAVSCGETYPQGGWILYNVIKETDAYAEYNVAESSKNPFVRLNSTTNSFQRPLGTIVAQEGKETYCYIGVDNESTPMNDVTMPDGRTQTFKHNSVGVWKCKLSEIDSQKDNGLLKYPAKQTCFAFQSVLGVMVFVGNYGEFGISFDNGETWISAVMTGTTGQQMCHFSGVTYDRKFSIDNYLIQLKK